jgi:hypothetical protein
MCTKALWKLQDRCVEHIVDLRELWHDVLPTREGLQVENKRGVFMDAGCLITMPSNIAKEIFKALAGEETEKRLLRNDMVKKRLSGMKSKTEAYIFEVHLM